MTAVLGSGKLFSGGTRIKTCEVYTHNDWKPVQALNDVAVVHLPTHVTFSGKSNDIIVRTVIIRVRNTCFVLKH